MKNTWSYSKSHLFNSCPKSLYFTLCESEDIIPKKPLPSKDVVNVWAATGIAVHKAIAKQMNNWARGNNIDFDAAQNEAVSYLNYLWSNYNNFFLEAINGKELDPKFQSRMAYSAKKSIQNFWKHIWPRFDDHRYIIHEQLKTFSVEGWPVSVKIDLGTYSPDETFVITDWKTGNLPVLGANTQQLNVYVLWAQKEYKIGIEQILVQLVNLKTGEIIQKRPNVKDLKESINRIRNESEIWKKMNEDDFPPKPNFEICISCRFLTICKSGLMKIGVIKE